MNDTAKIYFYPNKEKLNFIKMYDYHDFKAIDSVLVDTFHQKILDTKESHVFQRDTLISTLYSGKNQESKNYLYKGPIFCFLIKDKNNGGYHLIKKEFKTVIVNCDSLEKMKYYTP